MDREHPVIEIKCLTSPEIRSDDTIPFFDEVGEPEKGPPKPVPNPFDDDVILPSKPKRLKDMDKDKIHASDLGEVHTSPNNDTIVVNTPEGTLYITLEPDHFKSKPSSPSTGKQIFHLSCCLKFSFLRLVVDNIFLIQTVVRKMLLIKKYFTSMIIII